jgi:cell division protein FtsB
MRVAVICASFAAVALVFDGTLFRIWNLHREHDRIEKSISEIEVQTQALSEQVKKAKQLEFIEQQARDRLDLVEANDLVFEFSNENNEP